MLPAGTTLSRYVIEGPLGSGGMGSVYRARDTHLDREVALKVLSSDASSLGDSDARNRMVREARAVATLNHPNAVAIYDAGDSDHGPFIVMELVEGETLRSRMTNASPSEIIAWMSMTGLALHAAHARGIVHRDIKPENLMIRRDGIMKVLDFGIARRQRSAVDGSAPTAASLPTLTNTGVQIGTPQYMAPEQIKGKDLDGRADQFAWAVTTYEALAGKLPWSTAAGALGVVASILEEAPDDISTLRPDCPAHVGAVLARAMSKEPTKRYATMEEAARALRGESPATLESPAPKIERAPSSANARRPETRVGSATMQAVIGRALELEKADDRYARSEMEEAARELGISPDALAAATAAIKGERQSEPIRARIRENKRRAFFYHLVAYIGVNLAIVLPPLIIGNPGNKAAALFVPAISWGIGLVIHAMAAFRAIQPKDIRREIEKEERAVAKHVARRQALARHAEQLQERRARRRGARADLHSPPKPAKAMRIAVPDREAEQIDHAARAEVAGIEAELAELEAAATEEEARQGVRPMARPRRR